MILEYFQMIDNVVKIGDDELSIHAKAIVPEHSTVFEGHFPTMPLVPGVLLIETMAQAAGYMILNKNKCEFMTFLVGVKHAKLRQFVEPKTELDIFADMEHEGSGFSVAKAEIKNNDNKICNAELTFKLVEFESQEFKSIITNRIKEIGIAG